MKLFRKEKDGYKAEFTKKYAGYKPVGDGSSLQQFIDWLKAFSSLKIENIFEIGANFAQDAYYLSYKLKIAPENVYVFEAHPEIWLAITKMHKFNAYNTAVFNTEEEMTFNIFPVDYDNSGLSSLLTQPSWKQNSVPPRSVKVRSIRMDNFMTKNNIDKISFLKLDAEGVDLEVLQGFGDRLKDVGAIHAEAENLDNAFTNKKANFDDIKKLLLSVGFEMVFYQKYRDQSDSFWVKKEFIKE